MKEQTAFRPLFQDVTEEEVLAKGMSEKSKEFVKNGPEVYILL